MKALIAIGCSIGMLVSPGNSQQFTANVPIEHCSFSCFGGSPYFSLDPGRQLILRGIDDGEAVEVIITVLNETRLISLPIGDSTRLIQTRIIEERESADGELTEISSNYFARCIETGDVFYFGEDVDIYESGTVIGHDGAWLAGVSNALPGVIMPGSFLLGSRYFQEVAPGIALDLAEHSTDQLVITNAVGIFSNCVEIVETTALDPLEDPSIKRYAPGVGLIHDNGIDLESFRLNVHTGLAAHCTFTSTADHPYFPLLPGHEVELFGFDEDFNILHVFITVLDQTRTFPFNTNGQNRRVETRVVEEMEFVNGELTEISSNYFAQCHETQDIYYFGEHVDIYSNDVVIAHDGAWLAGENGATPGIIMPGHFAVGAEYFQEVAPGVAMDHARNDAAHLVVDNPSGTFSNCIRVVETTPLEPGDDPSIKVYAPGIGLIQDDGIELAAYHRTVIPPEQSVIRVRPATLLTWPLTDRKAVVEQSGDLTTWEPLKTHPVVIDGINQVTLPVDARQKMYRLTFGP